MFVDTIVGGHCLHPVNIITISATNTIKINSINDELHCHAEDFEIASLIANDYNFRTTYDKFIKLYKEIFDKIDYYEEVAEYEKSLKDQCYIGILSNLTVFDKERLDRQVDLSKYDYVFLSFEMNCEKPSREIYEKINDAVFFEPQNILLIDDSQKNIYVAKEFGWDVFKATGLELEKIKLYCEKFIKEVNSN